MSNRTLIELNHDYAPDLVSPEFSAFLGRYLRCADRESAAALERYGARVIAMRHHSDNFYVDADTDGFPPTYLSKEKVDARKR